VASNLDKKKLSRHFVLALSIVAVWALMLRFVLQRPTSFYDDAYIYLRYVKNTFGGCPLAFNCADGPVEGFTSPLHFVLLCVGHLVTDDLELAMLVVCVLGLGASMTVAVLMTRHGAFRESGFEAPWLLAPSVAAVLALDHYVLVNAVVGLEAGVASLIVGLIAYTALDPQQRGLRLMLVLGTLARPECAVLFAGLPLLPQARNLRYWVPLVAAALGIMLLRWIVFHDIMPNTFWAKTGGTGEHFALGWRYLLETLADFPLMLLSPLALSLKGCRRSVGFFLIGALLWGLFFLYSGGDFFSYSRFAFPLVPVLTVFALAGVTHLVAVVLKRLSEKPASTHTGTIVSRHPLHAPAQWAPAAALLVAVAVSVRSAAAHHIAEDSRLVKVERWKAVGRWMRQLPADTRVAATAIGAVGFYSELHVYDIVGLTSPDVAKRGQSVPKLEARKTLGHERHNTEWLLAQRPHLIMTLAWSDRPFEPTTPVETGVYGEWLLMEEVRKGRAPYDVITPEVAPGVYWFMFLRKDLF